MANLETGKNKVVHSNTAILLGCTDSSHSMRHHSSYEFLIFSSLSTSSYDVLDNPFYNSDVILTAISLAIHLSFKRGLQRSK